MVAGITCDLPANSDDCCYSPSVKNGDQAMSSNNVPSSEPHILKEFVEALAIEAARKDHGASLQERVRGRPRKRVLRPLSTEDKTQVDEG